MEQPSHVLGHRLVPLQRTSLIDSGASLRPTLKGELLVVLLGLLGRNLPRSVAVASLALKRQPPPIGAGYVVEQLVVLNLDLRRLC